MTKKQKKMLIRILIAAALMIVLHLFPAAAAGVFRCSCSGWFPTGSSDMTS